MATRRVRAIAVSKADKGQKVLASVYIGAAFLILIVGLKTLIQTKPDSWGDMIIVIFFGLSLFAIVGEFLLLMRYALHIRKEKGEGRQGITGASVGLDPALSGKIDELIQSNNHVVDSITEFEKQQKNSSEMLKPHTEAIVKISEGLDTLVNDEVDRKVQAAITKLISSKIN